MYNHPAPVVPNLIGGWNMATVLAKARSVKPIAARSAKMAPSNVRRAPTTNVSPLIQHALAVAGRHVAGDSRDRLKPGIYEVSSTVHIVGTLTVGKDRYSDVTEPPVTTDLLSLALSFVPVNSRARLIEDMLRKAAEDNGEVRATPQICFQHAQMIVEAFTRTNSEKRRGSVSGSFAIRNVQ
jgi:hypothetical protein